eukprot:scaffold89045_cov32-Tisochrysis_lutea.AAC.8
MKSFIHKLEARGRSHSLWQGCVRPYTPCALLIAVGFMQDPSAERERCLDCVTVHPSTFVASLRLRPAKELVSVAPMFAQYVVDHSCK